MANTLEKEKRSTESAKKIIAVGGAKGGVGKSLFVANLGVLLSRLGKRTVLVDLDMGAANLHIYLGIWTPPHRIDDFLGKRVTAIEEIMHPTKYGPLLIGGGGGRPGAANIHFSRKVKLLRALRSIDADYVILDLGGDTTYNSLDFYLAADQKLLLTTCDPAAYMDGYGFLKMSIYRKLTRLFGVESDLRKYRDKAVERIIERFIRGESGQDVGPMDEMVRRIEPVSPLHAGMIEKLLAEFSPGTIVNMFDDPDEVEAFIDRLGKVTRKMLCMDIDHFGSIPFDPKIRQSTRDLTPLVAQEPDGQLAGALRRILLKMEMA